MFGRPMVCVFSCACDSDAAARERSDGAAVSAVCARRGGDVRFIEPNAVPVSIRLLLVAPGVDGFPEAALSVTNASERPCNSGVCFGAPPRALLLTESDGIEAVPALANGLPGTNAGAVNDRLLNLCSRSSSSSMLRSRARRSRVGRSFVGRL